MRRGADGAEVELLEGGAESGAERLGQGAGPVGADVVEVEDEHLVGLFVCWVRVGIVCGGGQAV